MICPTCHGLPFAIGFCMECGGTGIAHCCDGPPEQPEITRDPPRYKIGDIIPLQFRNCGGSYGLEYPYIFANISGQWIIWHRHTGEVVYIETSKYPALHEYRCADECRRRNGLSNYNDPAINAAHDMEV